jgi:uncharacterized protein
MRRPAKRMLIALFVLLALYVGVCAFARTVYPRVLFPAPRLDAPPREVTEAITRGEAAMWHLPQADGRETLALFTPPRDERARVIVMLHGNGESMFDRLPFREALVARGLGVVLVEYRGYGLSHGPPPSEDDIYADASRVLDELAARGIAKDRVAVWGTSLGTGPAAEMARRGRVASLVLVTPFTSVVEIGSRFFPFLPVRLLLAHRFDTLSKAGEITCPTLVVHGDADEVVPFDMGERVARAVQGATFVSVPGGHHNDLFWEGRAGAPSAHALLERVVEHLAAARR